MENVSSNSTESSQDLEVGFVFIYELLSILIFPFYSHVFLKNVQKEKGSSIFEVNHCFYKINEKLYKFHKFLFFTGTAILFFIIVISAFIRLFFIFFFIYWAVVVFNAFIAGFLYQANCFLLILLAFQKFLIFFYPCSERFLTFNADEVQRFVWVTFLLAFGSRLMNWFTVWFFSGFYIFTNCLLLFATFLYLPIFWRIKKHSNLLSAQLNQPQRYVIWQLIVIIGLKISYIPFVLIFNYEKSIHDQIGTCETIDKFSTILTIQLTYLGCSKRNFQCFLDFLSQKWYIRMFKCCKICKKNRIEPMGNSETTVANFTRY